jgi:outer membrane protein assembly factor BamA
MPKGPQLIFLLFVLLSVAGRVTAQDNYMLYYHFSGKDTLASPQSLGLKSGFKNSEQCRAYTSQLKSFLQTKGYLTASIDSLVYDSLQASAWIYLGETYRWAYLKVPAEEQKILNAAGWNVNPDSGTIADFGKLEKSRDRLMGYMENNGYPFASVRLDSIRFDADGVRAKLQIDKGPLYKIDSIRVTGNVKIKNYFLQKYLDIEKGSIYRKEKLNQVSPRLMELPYLKESRGWDLTMLGTGSTLNLYLESRKSSQINALVGFLPDNTQVNGKLLLTGEANVNLKNALGGGETIGVNWQQLQVKSPRLNLAFQQPYIFRTALGLDFNFDLFKKDSSFLNLNMQIGIQYLVSARQSGKVFFQRVSTNLLTIDTNQVKATKQLPQYIDVATANIGVDYQFNNTDYRFNPRRGNDMGITFSFGLRKIKENSTITSLQEDINGNDFDFSSLYDTLEPKVFIFKLKGYASHFFKLTKQSTIKASLQGGWVQSKDIFKNEIFQIGGYKLLRGFDEESIFATEYAVSTVEYRFLIGVNSYLFGFTDFGLAGNRSYTEDMNHNYLGFGAGIAFETKAGIFNLTYAVGKRNDQNLNFRQSKIHFGFVSLF